MEKCFIGKMVCLQGVMAVNTSGMTFSSAGFGLLSKPSIFNFFFFIVFRVPRLETGLCAFSEAQYHRGYTASPHHLLSNSCAFIKFNSTWRKNKI